MFRVSKRILLAIEAILDIAYHANGEPVQSHVIALRQDIPRRYLEQTLQKLVRAGLLAGVRGPHGGYRLTRERRRISVGDIARALKDQNPSSRSEEDAFETPLGRAVLRPLWESLEAEALQKLDLVSIDVLCAQARGKNIPSEADDRLDFSI